MKSSVLTATVIVASAGNFIDMFDLFLFNMERVKSLGSFGLSGAALTDAGLLVANCQWAGLLLGSYLWGVLGDRRGRKASLLASILLYSLGSIASGAISGLHGYMAARFVTGLGIAGELGAGITLISESVSRTRRGTATGVFIVVGFLGCIAAALTTEYLPWRAGYMVGGAAGMVLLFTRTPIPESAMFASSTVSRARRGGLGFLLRQRGAWRRYFGGIGILLTGTFLPQIVWTLSPELAKAKGLTEAVKPNIVLAIGFGVGVIVDLAAAYLGDHLRSRRLAGLLSLLAGFPCFLAYLFWPVHSVADFYVANAVAAIGFGAWVVACSWIAECFGTDVRATAATTAPSLSRGASILMNVAYGRLKSHGALQACGLIGTVVFALAFLGWAQMPETYGKDLDYREAA